ncbi:MAG TPA: ABC transporter permease, partial [Cyclobacteriaceae bacterium]|nr:ABC transporter permease [Cyclobacteriaceae bacterium]
MILSYLTTAARNFKKNKVHTFITISGLSLGMMATILALMFIMDERSFDQFHSRKNRIYRVNKVFIDPNKVGSKNGESSGMIGPTMREDFPEVESVVRYHPWYEETVLSNGDKTILLNAQDLSVADSTFFQVFDFPLVSGDPKRVLTRPSTIVISEPIAHALFGNENPIGKTVVGISDHEFEVTGICKVSPRNSHIQFKAIMSWATTVPQLGPQELQQTWMNNWIAQGIRTYVLLKEGADPAAVEAKFPAFMQQHSPDRADRYKPYLQKFTDMYLYSSDTKYHNLAVSGNIQFVNLFTIIALFMLAIACINYINISTSKSTRRAREVGMRKTMGASRGQLINQFMGESFLLVTGSAIFAMGLVYLALPLFNELTGKSIPATLLLDPVVLGGSAALILLVSVLSGSYPSLLIASFSASEVLRGGGKSKVSGHLPRYALITFQFTASIIMIAATLLVYQQIRFVQSKDLGFDKDHILVLDLTDALKDKKEVLQNAVDAFPNVLSTSVGRTALARGSSSTYVIPEGFNPDEIEVRTFPVDGYFQRTYDLKMESGHFFDPTKASDSAAFIINEALVRRLHWDNPLGKTIKFGPDQPAWPVIGVLRDFNFKSLYDDVEPLVMWVSRRRPENMSIRFSGNPAPLLAFLEGQWKTYETRYPFQYTFLDQDYEKMYASEEKLFKTLITFAGLSILIACLGLYGLVSYTIEQRTKEFGIRKVLGASVSSLNILVNRKFVWMVAIAAAIAIPVVIPMIGNWLSKFKFRIAVGPEPFILSILITLAV